jgi:primase-polymerase (primpol)-like protein
MTKLVSDTDVGLVGAKLLMRADGLPREIRESLRAVVWKHEERDGKETKIPYVATRPRERAAVNDANTWGRFEDALYAVQQGQADGVGVVLGDGLVGVDLDHVRDPDSGALAEEAVDIVRALDSYTEVSPSGTGLHVLVRGTLPPGGRRKDRVEMYSAGRYFTVTGEHLAGTLTRIAERTAALFGLHACIFGTNREPPFQPSAALAVEPDDAALLERAHAARNGGKFAALWRGDWRGRGYPTQSEADQALANLLAWWTGGDGARVDALFRRSGLWRPKWDSQRREMTYGELTIATALAVCGARRRT